MFRSQVIKALADLVESPGGALWLRHDEAKASGPVSRSTWRPSTPSEPAERAARAFLERTGWVIDLDEYAAEPDALFRA